MRLTAPPGDPDGLPGLVTGTVPDPPGDAVELLLVTVRIDWFDGTNTASIARSLRDSRVGGYESDE